MQKRHFLLYKKLILFILPILLVPSISFWAIWEEECLSCWSSPKEFVLINDFTTEMLGQIRTIGTAWKYTGKFVPPSWFESWKFVAPKDLVLWKMLRRSKESLSLTIWLGNIVQQLWNPISIADEFAILSRNQVFFRDWKKLGLVETAINKKKFELSMGWWREDKIKWVPEQRMKSIIENYKREGIIKNYKFEWARYYEILVVLGAINNDMKHMIALWWTQMVKDDDSSLFSSKFQITLSDTGINNMKMAYKCALWFKCDNPLTNFKDLWKWFKVWWASSLLEFNKANERFGVAMKRFGTDIQKRKDDMVKKYKELWWETKDKVSGDLQEIGDTRSKPFEGWRKQQADKDLKTITITDINTTTQNSDDKNINVSIIENKINKNIKNIILEAQDMDKTLNISSVKDITINFSELIYTISNLTKNVIWAKWLWEKSLIDNLGQVCEKQCTNIGGKKYYY